MSCGYLSPDLTTELPASGFDVTQYDGYDAHGNLTHVTYADNTWSSFAYTSTLSTHWYTRDPNGQQTTSTPDNYGNLLDVVDALGRHTQYEYTLAPAAGAMNAIPGGLVKKITDPLGRVTDFEYYESGNLIGLVKKKTITGVSSLGGIVSMATSYAYDQYRHLKTATDLTTGLVTTYQYDLIGQLPSVFIGVHPWFHSPLTPISRIHAEFAWLLPIFAALAWCFRPGRASVVSDWRFERVYAILKAWYVTGLRLAE